MRSGEEEYGECLRRHLVIGLSMGFGAGRHPGHGPFGVVNFNWRTRMDTRGNYDIPQRNSAVEDLDLTYILVIVS